MNTWRTGLAAAITAAVTAIAAGTAWAVTPIDGGDAGGTATTVNNGPGDQSEPHVSGNLAVYTDRANIFTPGTIHYFDFLTGNDSIVPGGDPGDSDVLSDVNGNRIVFSRTRAADNATAVMLFDLATGFVTELDPAGSTTMRFGAVAGGDTVAFAEFDTGGGDIFAYDLVAGTATNISQSPDLDINPAVTPAGNVLVWEQCIGSNCNILQSVRTGGVWGAPTVVAATPSNESNPDSDGTTVVYDRHELPLAEQDVYWKPVTGGAEAQLEMVGLQRNPAISGGVVTFESKDTPETPADLFAYVIATNTVYRVTNTPAVDETLNDVSVLPSGAIRVVWAADDDVEPGLHNVYARTFTLPSSNPTPPAEPGDILVVDPDVPPVSTAVLFTVDAQTGARTVLSDFGASSPNAVAVEGSGNILVTDTDAGTDPSGGTSEWGALYRISRDPVTGDLVRTILTDFGVGPSTGRNPRAVAVEANGQILVINGNGGTTDRAVLVRVDPNTGARTIVSDFGSSGQGGLGVEPRGVAVEAGGTILVIDAQAGTFGQGQLVRIDPQTGARTSLSNFGDNATGPSGSNPTAVAVDSDGQILVTDEGQPSTTPLGLLFRVDPQTGARTILSDFNTGTDTGREPEGVALEASGQILVVDKHAGPFNRGMLFRVNPQSGDRTIVSDFGTGDNQGGDPLAVAVVPQELATLIVIKQVLNDNGGSARPSDFTITVDGVNPFPASFPGKDPCGVSPSPCPPPSTTVILGPGPYSVSESGGPAGYTGTFSADCAGTIAAGETKTCTITNDDPAARLVVINEVVNDDGGTAMSSAWFMTVTGSNPSPANFDGAAAPGTAVTLGPGSYSVDASGPTGYTSTPSPDCAGTIAAGETKTCTITHDDQPATLVVINEVVNDSGGTAAASDWTMTVTGSNPSPASFPGAAAPGTTVTLDPGAYSVSESGPAGYGSTASADCAGTVAAGEAKTCTITNDDQPPAVPTCDGKVATIVGQPGQIEIRGTRFDDVIIDLEGDNIVRGRGGNDTICTGDGDDQIIAGDGADTIIDTGGVNTVQAGAGADSITTSTGDDTINAGIGADTVIDAGGNNTVEGGAGGDTVTTGAGNDHIDGGLGNDTVDAGEGDNTVNGQAGDDAITTGDGDDEIDGGLGFDSCTPGAGNNIVTRCEA